MFLGRRAITLRISPLGHIFRRFALFKGGTQNRIRVRWGHQLFCQAGTL